MQIRKNKSFVYKNSIAEVRVFIHWYNWIYREVNDNVVLEENFDEESGDACISIDNRMIDKGMLLNTKYNSCE